MANTWEQWKKAKATAIEYLAVFISGTGFVFAVIATVIATTAIYIAYDANENAKIAIIRLDSHLAEDHK